MSAEGLAEQVCRYAALVWQRGLVEAAGGNVSARAPGAPAVILQHHGVIAFGRDLEEAFCRVDLVEKTARVWYLMRAVGGPLPDPESIA